MPRAPPPPLPLKRMDVVEAAWHKVAGEAESVPVEQLKAAYDASRHPRVLDGVMSVAQAQDVVARNFDSVADGVVTWNEFLQYHIKMSGEIDRSRAIDRDASFVQIVVQQWRLDKDPESALQPTGIIPSTLECPRGLKQTKNMELIWCDPNADKKNALCAFRGVVKTRFSRSILPPAIRGYFAFADELTDFAVKACVARSALLSPLSVVWVDEQSNRAVGFKEVISPNIDLSQLPEGLQAVVMTDDAAEKLHGAVEWLPLVTPFNPMYTKSSEAFGQGAADQAQEVLNLKRKVWEGTNCGVAWHGHTGKFTDGFNGGAQPSSGLNTASRRPRV